MSPTASANSVRLAGNGSRHPVCTAGATNAWTAVAAEVYFWARAAHYLVCLSELHIVPRTLAFLVGVGAQLVLVGTLVRA
ncbi:MAPEG family protein [Caldimonas mangrovi]|uniref:MAPEG family protein n=1 Tax=Caldimonas mangrovi TaxID=2944811 RepID=UPI0034A451A9